MKIIFAVLMLSIISLADDPDFVLEGQAATMLPLGFKAFVPMKGESKILPIDPGRIIADDLDFSGSFIFFD